MSDPKLSTDLEPLIRLTLKLVVGAGAFAVVFLTAVLLNLLVRATETHTRLPAWLVASTGWVEVLLWTGDLVVYGLFVVREVVEAVREYVREWRAPHHG